MRVCISFVWLCNLTNQIYLIVVLGEQATSAPILYANTNHPELKNEFPNWPDRYKQIIKRWRALSIEIKTPYNQKARENRTSLRMKKTQQVRMFGYTARDELKCDGKELKNLRDGLLLMKRTHDFIRYYLFGALTHGGEMGC